ncbi:MAG: urea transporter [Myxococcales bacterium]|nr:urea transporter [Myxococcales bacterium]
MRLELRADGLAVEGNVALSTLDAVLRGVGQVMLQNNTWAGLLFAAGAFAASPAAGASLLAGATISTLVAALLGADRGDVRAGLYGFNGALVGIALAVFLRMDAFFWALLVGGAGGATVVAAALSQALRAHALPALTAPFVLVTWAILAGHPGLSHLRASDAMPVAHLAAAAAAPGAVALSTLAEGTARGLAQVFVQDHLASAALVLAGLLLASRRAAAAAVLGALGGTAVGAALGAGEPALRTGLFGYNSALTAVALVALLPSSRWAALYALFAVAATAVASAATSALLAPLGLPGLTAAFVGVTWGALLAAPGFGRVVPRGAAPKGGG